MLPVKTACKFRRLFPWNTPPQDKSHPSRGENQPSPPWKKGAGEMNSLQTLCSLGLVSWPFHSGEEALPRQGLGTLSVAAQCQWPKSSAGVTAAPVASAPSRTPGRGAWDTNTCRFHQAGPAGRYLPSLPSLAVQTLPGASPKTGQGLPRAASPVPPQPVVKLQQMGCDSIQAV